jgi:hypothetical protein
MRIRRTVITTLVTFVVVSITQLPASASPQDQCRIKVRADTKASRAPKNKKPPVTFQAVVVEAKPPKQGGRSDCETYVNLKLDIPLTALNPGSKGNTPQVPKAGTIAYFITRLQDTDYEENGTRYYRAVLTFLRISRSNFESE